ncbi:hypothetical protein HK097_005837, partial [Rhizophlyctis rosea]
MERRESEAKGKIPVGGEVKVGVGRCNACVVGETGTKAIVLSVAGGDGVVSLSGRSDTKKESRFELKEVSLKTVGEYREDEEGFGGVVDELLWVPSLVVMAAAGERMRINMGTAKVFVCLRVVYVGLLACLGVWKVAKLFRPGDRAPKKVDPGAGKRREGKEMEVVVAEILLDIDLPEDVKIKLSIIPLSLLLDNARRVYVEMKELGVDVEVDKALAKYRRLLDLKSLEITTETLPPPPTETLPLKKITVTAKSTHLTVPHNFLVSSVIDNAINLQKAIKLLLIEHLGISPQSSHPSLPRHSRRGTTVDKGKIPIIVVGSEEVRIEFEDDPFEGRLSRNYLLGVQEGVGRGVRDLAFWKRARTVGKEGKGVPPEVEDAFWLLQEFNSKSWIERVKREERVEEEGGGSQEDLARDSTTSAASPRKSKWFPPLLVATFQGVSVRVSAPSLPAQDIETSLHILDPSTPPDLIYDELIPRNICWSMKGLEIRLRDYPIPFIHIPTTSQRGGESWRSEGLMVIAEQVMGSESKRKIGVNVKPLIDDDVAVVRTIVPTKIYLNIKTSIVCEEDVRICWGASVEPCIGEAMMVLDGFTKPSVDPSAPVGWWDKVRLVVRGGGSWVVRGGG